MALTVANARGLIASVIRGGASDTAVKAEALEAYRMAMSTLNDREWEFARITACASASAGEQDYDLPSGLSKIYSVRWGLSHALTYTTTRIDERLRPDKSASTPTHYTLFQSDNTTGAGSFAKKLRIFPTPGEEVPIYINGYRSLEVATATGGNVDLPDEFVYWPVYQGRSYLLAARPGTGIQRASFWQREAERLMLRMKHYDRYAPDQDLAFISKYDNNPVFPIEHAWNWVQNADGF